MRNMTITGFIVADAEVKQSTAGKDFATFRLVNHEFDSKSEEKRDTFWVRVTAPNHAHLAKYYTKGKFVGVIGRYVDSTWTRKDGSVEISRDIYATEITFESNGTNKNKPEERNTSTTPQATQRQSVPLVSAEPLPPGGEEEDGLPF